MLYERKSGPLHGDRTRLKVVTVCPRQYTPMHRPPGWPTSSRSKMASCKRRPRALGYRPMSQDFVKSAELRSWRAHAHWVGRPSPSLAAVFDGRLRPVAPLSPTVAEPSEALGASQPAGRRPHCAGEEGLPASARPGPTANNGHLKIRNGLQGFREAQYRMCPVSIQIRTKHPWIYGNNVNQVGRHGI